MRTTKSDRKELRRCVPMTPESAYITRAEDGSEVLGLRGLASATDIEYVLWPADGGWKEEAEIVQPGAFAKTLSENLNIQVLREHNVMTILASTGSGTARVWENTDPATGPIGLWFDVPDIGRSEDMRYLHERVQKGIISQCSFAFWILDEEIIITKEKELHVLKELKVKETSICANGANPHTKMEARGLRGIGLCPEPEDDDHSEADDGGLDGADPDDTSEPDGDHSETEARAKRDCLRARLRLLAEA